MKIYKFAICVQPYQFIICHFRINHLISRVFKIEKKNIQIRQTNNDKLYVILYQFP